MIDMIQNVASISQAKGLGSMVTDQMSSATQVQGATPGSEAGMTFASVLGDMATEAMNNLKQSEVKSIDGINGKANTREVVDAVLAAVDAACRHRKPGRAGAGQDARAAGDAGRDRADAGDHYWPLIRSMVIDMRSRACFTTCRLAS